MQELTHNMENKNIITSRLGLVNSLFSVLNFQSLSILLLHRVITVTLHAEEGQLCRRDTHNPSLCIDKCPQMGSVDVLWILLYIMMAKALTLRLQNAMFQSTGWCAYIHLWYTVYGYKQLPYYRLSVGKIFIWITNICTINQMYCG